MEEWAKSLIRYVFYAAAAVLILQWALATQRETVRLHGEVRQLEEQVTRLGVENARLEQVRDALEKDPFLIERLLRERYGYRRPNEEDLGRNTARTVDRRADYRQR